MSNIAPQRRPWALKNKKDAELFAEANKGAVITMLDPNGQPLGYLVLLPSGGKIDSEGYIVLD